MALYYVSQTATNGYAVGSDANSGLTPLLAKLTIAAAVSASSANDYITINDGTYVESDLDVNKALTIRAQNSGQVIIQNSSTTFVARLTPGSGNTTNITGIVFDGTATNTRVVYLNTGSAYNINLTDVTVKGIKSGSNNGLAWNNNGLTTPTVTCTNCTFECLVTTSGSLMQLDAVASGSVTCTGCTFTMTPSTSSGQSIFLSNTSSISAMTLTNCTFTAQGVTGTTHAIRLSNTSTITTLTITGSTFNLTAPSGAAVDGLTVLTSSIITTLTASNNTFNITNAGSSNAQGIISTQKVMAARISSNTFNCTMTSTGTIDAVNLTASVQPTSFRADYNKITFTTTSTSASCQGITVNNYPASVIEYNSFVHTGAGSAMGPFITTASSATWSCLGCIMRNNTVSVQGGTGYLMRMGEETQSNSYTYLTYPIVYGNVLVGDLTKSDGIHGLMMGGIKFGFAWGNTVKYATLNLLSKLCEDTIFSGNVSVSGSSLSGNANLMRFKSGLRCSFINNIAIANDTLTTSFSQYMFFCDENDASHYTTNCVFSNNIVYHNIGRLADLVNVAVNNSCSFYNNDYYSLDATTPYSYAYQGVSYNSFATWVAAIESTALNVLPVFVNTPVGNFRLYANSPLYHAGHAFTGTASDIFPVDFTGAPFYSTPTIGAYEFGINAAIDQNSVKTLLGTSNANGKSVVPIRADSTTHGLAVSNGTSGSDLGPTNAPRDENSVPALMAVSSEDGVTPVAVYADAGGNLLIKTT